MVYDKINFFIDFLNDHQVFHNFISSGLIMIKICLKFDNQMYSTTVVSSLPLIICVSACVHESTPDTWHSASSRFLQGQQPGLQPEDKVVKKS